MNITHDCVYCEPNNHALLIVDENMVHVRDLFIESNVECIFQMFMIYNV